MSPIQALRRLLQIPPRGMESGNGSRVQWPHRISHPESIQLGARSYIHRNALITPIHEYAGRRYSPKISIGADVYIGPNLFLACLSRVVIGDGSVLSESVYINDCSHGLDPTNGLIMEQPLVHGGDISIGKSCFIGLRCAIMPGVNLGDHCVVGINSVVTRSFPAYSMVCGSPARLVRRFDPIKNAWISVKRSEPASEQREI
jgi:lipopolysaccharide O-acetyltransferase